MAARRLKLKPKPLVGLIRRSKDLNNGLADVPLRSSDLIGGCQPVSFNTNENDTVSEKSSVHEEVDKLNSVPSEQFKNRPNQSLCEKLNPVPTAVLDHDSTDSSINSVDFDSNNRQVNEGLVQSDLKSDINLKIRTVISDSKNLKSSNKSELNDYLSSCIVKNKSCSEASVIQTVEEGDCVTESDESSRQLRPTIIQKISSSKSDDNDQLCKENSSLDNNKLILNAAGPSSISGLRETNYDKADATVISSVHSENNESKSETENKDAKNCNPVLKIPSRFGKTRFKPVLSNIARKKDGKSLTKNDDSILELPSNSKTNTVEESSVVFDNESCTVGLNNEKLIEKENIDKNIRILEESVTTTEKEPTVIDKTLPLLTKNSDEPVLDRQTDILPPVETEGEQPVRSPVKLFQPKKRQRSHGASLSNFTYKALQDFKDKFKDGNIDKSKLMMRDLIFYNPKTNPMPMRQSIVKLKKEQLKNDNSCASSIIEDKLDEENVDDIHDDESESSMPVPQVKVGPDGKIILDPKSLVIEATGIQKGRANLEKSEIVQENEFSYTKYHKRRVRRTDWSAEETLLFYKALNDLGADFSLMQSLFPKKTRKDLKLKFKKEERINVHLIDKAMRSSGNFDFAALEIELKKDREERQRILDEQRKLREKKKEKKEQPVKKAGKSVAKSPPKPKGDSDVEMSNVKVNKKNEDKVKRILTFKINKKDEVDESEKTVQKKPRGRKPKKEKENIQEFETDLNETSLIDSQLLHSSSDDGIVSDFIDEENDDDVDMAALNSKIFKKTRFGRQPKLKLIRDDSAGNDDSPRPRKISRKENTKRVRNIDNNSALNQVLNETAREFNTYDNNVALSEQEIHKVFKKKFERYYQLFKEPFDVSNFKKANFKGLVNRDCNDDSNECGENNNEDLEDNINDSVNSEIINSSFPSIFDQTPRKERDISESLQIMEELTSSENPKTMSNDNSINDNIMDYGVYILPDNDDQYMLPCNACEGTDTSNEVNEDCMDSSDSNSRFIYSLNNDQIIVEGDGVDDENITNQFTPIIINNLQPMPSTSTCLAVNAGQKIQIISQEQINYILRQGSNVILPEINEEDSSADSSYTTEPISHSKIHCYPSSDHTYTSLKPKPVKNNKTYVILTEVSSEEMDNHAESTIVVYPESNIEVPP